MQFQTKTTVRANKLFKIVTFIIGTHFMNLYYTTNRMCPIHNIEYKIHYIKAAVHVWFYNRQF